eukprot:5409065-Prymnesium_polylepis.2
MRHRLMCVCVEWGGCVCVYVSRCAVLVMLTAVMGQAHIPTCAPPGHPAARRPARDNWQRCRPCGPQLRHVDQRAQARARPLKTSWRSTMSTEACISTARFCSSNFVSLRRSNLRRQDARRGSGADDADRAGVE